MNYFRVLITVLLLVTGILWGAHAEPPAPKNPAKMEKEKIIEVVDRFFQVLEFADPAIAREILMPQGAIFSLRLNSEEKELVTTDFKAFIESLPNIKDKYKETMSKTKVLVHKGIAVVWTDYEFFINGQKTHHGKDAFSLVKINGKWRIASIVYTVEPLKGKR